MKKDVLIKVKEFIEKRMQNSFEAMEAAKNSANEEGKSSAGDKYETARAMGQLDREMNGRMYDQARQERLLLDKIDLKNTPTKAVFGALIKTNIGYYFLSIGAGLITLNNDKIMAISLNSPIGQAIAGKTLGESFIFNGKPQQIEMIC